MSASPVIFQLSALPAWMQRIDLVDVAAELARAWAFAQNMVGEVLVGYRGELHLAVGLGALHRGITARGSASTIEQVRPSPARPTGSWKGDFELPLDTGMGDLIHAVLGPLTRALGYTGIELERMLIAPQVEREIGKEW